MKIAYVLNTYPQPSHSFIRRELGALERQGFDVTRLAMRRADVPLVDAGDIAESARTEYVLDARATGLLMALVFMFCSRPSSFIRAFALALKTGSVSPNGRLKHLVYLAEAAFVTRRCKRDGIQHMHAHFGTNAATVAMLARTLGGPSYSFTVHGPEEFDAPTALSLGSKIENSAFTVAISQFGRSQLCRWVDADAWSKIKVVHCGIEKQRFLTTTPPPKTGLNLVAIGRFVEQKGQMVLVPALKRLRDIHPDVHLFLVGDGPLKNTLESAISKTNLNDNVTFTGWLDEADLRGILDKSHALLMPSFAEGLPMVVMEAMAAARPVIATYVAGTPELVRQGQTGWLVPAGDPDAIAAAVIELARKTEAGYSKMGKSGRKRVLERHDVEIEAAKLAQHFRDSIG